MHYTQSHRVTSYLRSSHFDERKTNILIQILIELTRCLSSTEVLFYRHKIGKFYKSYTCVVIKCLKCKIRNFFFNFSKQNYTDKNYDT